jgi:hypothetical protein
MKIPARLVSGFVLALIFAMMPARSSGQTAAVAQRITTAIDNQNLTILHGNVHPLAKGEFDQGAAADAQALHRMLLLLRRSPEQELALQQLLNDQQDKSSGHYHGWLSPEQFGAQFGPSDADIQAVTQWLESQGFSGVAVGAGRTTIEFSGNAGQVRNAFHTQIRRYAIKGAMHFANATDPETPAALAPVVAGIVSLNDFPIQSHLQRLGTFQKSLKTGETRPLFTFPGCGGNCYGVGPADFAKIYNTQPLLSGSPKIDGTGQGIAIVGESNIKVQNVSDFRTMFGLTPQNFSASNVIVNGEDPGITDSEDESDLDVQWSGAVAPGARIDFVTSESTETTPGINLSAIYIVDHNLDAVMSESFGGCEKTIGTTFNQFFNALWEQASAQGITVVVSAGDNGSAGCDDFNSAQSATQGLAVSGFASTPYNVAVGGTDFDQANRISTYWNTVPTSDSITPTPASAKSYIPEIPWNDTCAQLGISGCTAANINGISAGSGGVSTLYAKPSWQAGKGVPADGHRDLPDVSLFAPNGFNGSFYIFCQSDITSVPCGLTDFTATFQGAGGTSVSAPAFAGIMALVNQKLATGSNPAPRQGNANYHLYALAQQQVTANLSCNSSTPPAATCSFNDVSKGNNDVPCTGASTNCSSKVAAKPGVLVTAASPTVPAFTTTAGYDIATGLGSLNVQNVVNKWSSVNTTPTSVILTLNNGAAVNVTHGQAVPFQISVGPTTASGDASLIATPTGNTTGIGPFPLAGGAASGTTSQLPGGTSYNVVAHYEGNGTDAPSNSSPVAVTVAAEPSKVFITVPTFNPETGQETTATPTTLVYGSPYILRADVTNATSSLSALCKPPSCPSGTVTFADTIGGVNQGAPNNGTFSLNSNGFTENQPVQFPGGTNVITATYSGDGSFSAPAQPATYTLNVTPAPTQMAISVGSFALATQPMDITSSVITNLLNGGAPTGIITFFDGATQLPGTVRTTARVGDGTSPATKTGDLLVTFQTSGTHNITAQYGGDPSYAASTSAADAVKVVWQTTLAATPSTNNVIYGQSVQITATVTSQAQTPAMGGNFQIEGMPQTFPGTPGVDGSGNQTLTATFSVTPNPAIGLNLAYSGDSNFAASFFVLPVTVTIPDFSITPNAAGLVVSANQLQATTTLTVTPLSSAASTVTLSCSTPFNFQPATCNVAPSIVTLTGGQPASATLTFAISPLGTESQNATKAPAKRRGAFIAWTDSDWWGPGWGAAALAMFAFSLLPGFWRNQRMRVMFATSAVVLLAVACGGGSSGSGGTGNLNQTVPAVPTTTALTFLSPKVAANQSVLATATITSTNPVSGAVQFFELSSPDLPVSAFVDVQNSKATTSIALPGIGIYGFYAQYMGDSLNQKSKSATVPATVTGTTQLGVSGTTATLVHNTPVTLSVQ